MSAPKINKLEGAECFAIEKRPKNVTKNKFIQKKIIIKTLQLARNTMNSKLMRMLVQNIQFF